MADVLAQFSAIVRSRTGPSYAARACGEQMSDGRWEGWIEFVPMDGGAPIRSGRETTQPNRDDTVYWANGLTPIYLDGALLRALKPRVIKMVPPAHATLESSARNSTKAKAPAASRPVLDPFSVYENGEVLLRQELGALCAWRLANIVCAYQLTEQPPAVLNQLSRPALIDLIVRGVRALTSPMRISLPPGARKTKTA